ncbi:MAG TPA: choice-of-anchor L domain-containing protein, partial [Bacteroidia bacterium]|nr:choice-of-anchor L domain-containing protein [Bacteroidia bacterium]
MLCFCALDSFSQLQVVPNNNATQLAQTLQGAGVVVTNATINCPVGASGTFDGTASDINIAGGVLLTTGSVSRAVGPNSNGSEGLDNSIVFNDPQLIAIEPLAKYDPCILEFDATPSCDTLGFTFSFGSEEYLEFVNGGYNDVFGIFVSGANPAGAAYTNYNVALIPSTNIAVSIDNVNTTSNPAYFFNNVNGTSVQYDGFTKPIDVALRVVPCTPYHFKLAIADAGDGAYDSGVFFANHSLECNVVLSIATTSTSAQCGSNSGTATVTNVTGGTPPYSYEWNSNPVQTTTTATGLVPGNYMVTIIDAGGCISGTATVAVNASGGSFPVTISQTDVSCYGFNNGVATISPTGGTSPYTYLWNTNPVKTTASVSALPAGTYTCLAKDAVGCTQTTTVTITQPTAVTATISNVVNVSCKGGKNGSATASAAGGTPGYIYVWNTSPAQSSAVASNLSAGNYVVTVTDTKSCTVTQSVTITESTAITLNTTSTPASCATKDGTATVSASSGTPPYTYLWLTSPIQSAPTATGLGDGVYTIIVTDANGCT